MKWKLLFVNACECNSQIYNVTDSWNWRQRDSAASTVFGNYVKDTQGYAKCNK